jgi:hypothetical protein
MHAIRSLAGCCSGEDILTKDNATIGIVGKDTKFYTIEGDDLVQYLNRLEEEGGNIAAAAADDDAATAAAGDAMEA